MDENDKIALPTDPLIVGLPEDLMSLPTVETYRWVMARENWPFYCEVIRYLREYERGFQGIEYLLQLTDRFKDDLSKEEVKVNKWRLWQFYLELLDKTDRWEDYLATVEMIRQNPEGQELLSAPNIIRHRSGGWHYDTFGDGVKAVAISRIKKREPLIQKKLALKKAGKSVKRYLHKDPDEITGQEYLRRIEVLKYWRYVVPKQHEAMYNDLREIKRKMQEQGEEESWLLKVEVSFGKKDDTGEGQ